MANTPAGTGGFYGALGTAANYLGADPNDANYGGSGMSRSAYYAKYGDPNQQGAGAEAAQHGATTQGNNAAINPAINPALPNTTVPGAAPTPGMLSGPGYGEQWWQQHGNDLSGKTNSQKLFDEGDAGSNPFYQNAIKTTNDAINLQSAARGEGNSGAALGEIGTADANLLGQQALGLTQLSGQADSANTSQFNAGSGASATAEGLTNARGAGAAAAYTNLSQDQANMVDNFYSMASKGELTADMAGIEAQLAASGVDAATATAIANDLTSLASAGIKAGSK